VGVKLVSWLRLAACLALVNALLPSLAVAQDNRPAGEARQIYGQDCISCHGPRGEGVSGTGPARGADETRGAGPPLGGVGPAAIDFYLSTGYMPLANPRDRPKHRGPGYSPEQIRALVAYIDSLPARPSSERKLAKGPPIPNVRPELGNVAEGFDAFTEHCAGCHQVLGEGGNAESTVAPELRKATPLQIAEAIRIGPYLMPRFGERQIDDRAVDSIVRYVEYARHPRDAGGWGIGHVGPIPEGFVAWCVAGLALVGVARLLGKRIR
jgi:ubiquinol-cytochrome c reductase cytochrome c subunit